MRRSGFAALRARLGVWLAAFALLSQSLAVAAPMPTDAASAARQLSAWLGPGVVVCAHDDSDAPTPAHDCHDQCPICQLAAAAWDAPGVPPLAAPTRAAAPLAVAGSSRPLPVARPRFSLARGPPTET